MGARFNCGEGACRAAASPRSNAQHSPRGAREICLGPLRSPTGASPLATGSRLTLDCSGRPGLQGPAQRHQEFQNVLRIQPLRRLYVCHVLVLVRFGRESGQKWFVLGAVFRKKDPSYGARENRRLPLPRQIRRCLIRPIPRRLIQNPLPDNPGLPEILLQHDAIALRVFLQCRNQAPGVGNHPHLTLL